MRESEEDPEPAKNGGPADDDSCSEPVMPDCAEPAESLRDIRPECAAGEEGSAVSAAAETEILQTETADGAPSGKGESIDDKSYVDFRNTPGSD